MIVFVHIPKTGGTTLNHVFRAVYGDAAFHRVQPGGGWRKASAPKGARVVSGHMPWGVFDGATVTILRDPIERMLSLWWFARKHTNIAYHGFARKHSLAGFVKGRLIAEVDNGMTRWLAARAEVGRLKPGRPVDEGDLQRAKVNLSECRFVGFTESLDADIGRLGKLLRWKKVPGVGRQMVSENKPRLDELADGQADAVREMSRFDVELYRWAREELCA